jgi:hypothetical protein
MEEAVGATVIVDVPFAIVMVRLVEPVPAVFDAEIDDVKVPAVLGVPEITPVEVLTDNPEGKLLAL